MDKTLLAKLADVPPARAGYETLDMSAPVLVQMNPTGRWENVAPDSLDEDRLRAVVQHLVTSKAVSAAQSYCCQCAAENKIGAGGQSEYVPVIMMPLAPADRCPFDMDCELDKIKQADLKPKKKLKSAEVANDSDAKDKKKKKRGFVMQRLTDFDLMSQW